MAEHREHTGRDRDVVEERQQRDPAVFPRAHGARRFAERVGDVERDADDDEDDRDDRVLLERGTDRRADRLEA